MEPNWNWLARPPGRSEIPRFRHRGEAPQERPFANRAEVEYAKWLDFYHVPWLYEPTTFVLAYHEDGRPSDAFTPDFYLIEQDLYLEVTVMKQSLATRKNRKVRLLQDRHPETKVRIFYRRDYLRIFGHPQMTMLPSPEFALAMDSSEQFAPRLPLVRGRAA